MSSCLIQLDNCQEQYYPGSSIAGRVICTFKKSENIRDVKIMLKGKEHNEWMETTISIYYSGSNTFLRNEISLHSGGKVGPGRLELPFTFQLPANIPSSYEGHYGGVFYAMEARVDRSYKFDYKNTILMVVTAPVDFDLISAHLFEPTTYFVEKTLCCWCCNSCVMTMKVHLEKEVFVVGEVANIRVDVTNNSKVSIESVDVKLKMKVTSRVVFPSSESKRDSVLLAASSHTGVKAQSQRNYEFGLLIPESTQAPNFNLSKLFSQKTKLKVTAVLSGCHRNMKLATYITMCGKPSHNSEKYPLMQFGDVVSIKNEMVENESDDPWSNKIPPPSYNEAMADLPKQ